MTATTTDQIEVHTNTLLDDLESLPQLASLTPSDFLDELVKRTFQPSSDDSTSWPSALMAVDQFHNDDPKTFYDLEQLLNLNNDYDSGLSGDINATIIHPQFSDADIDQLQLEIDAYIRTGKPLEEQVALSDGSQDYDWIFPPEIIEEAARKMDLPLPPLSQPLSPPDGF